MEPSLTCPATQPIISYRNREPGEIVIDFVKQ